MPTNAIGPTVLRIPGDEHLVKQVRRGHRRYLIEIDGTLGTAAEWAEAADIKLSTFYDRLKRGDRGMALLRPAQRQGRPPMLITALGRTQTAVEWAKETGIPKSSISSRLKRRWSPDDAVTVAQGEERPPGAFRTSGVKIVSSTDSKGGRASPQCPALIPNAPDRRRRFRFRGPDNPGFK